MHREKLIDMALLEDATDRDLTCMATIAAGQQGNATITAKAVGTLSGITIAKQIFEKVDPAIKQQWYFVDGDRVQAGDVVCELSGSMHALLAAERTALNFLQHLSGIATATQAFVDAMEGTECKIADTRKTTPGMRHLEKEAVVHGGGVNHRVDLASGMLIKENHIEACGTISEAVGRCFEQSDKVWVEVECENMEQVQEAIHACPDIILLDNMTPETVAEARKLIPTSILLEASGNITLTNARQYAETGINRIAIGAITHSAPALDLSMRVTATK
jgi:nicotinate-nucleotide pyrophosphorylase (carboxylating)